jgi:hypothetical protein
MTAYARVYIDTIGKSDPTKNLIRRRATHLTSTYEYSLDKEFIAVC